jgi:dephospho-CoA kinase
MNRRVQRRPYIIGLTGSIAMGKSTTAAMLRQAGVPVFDADATVHLLTRPGGPAIAPIAKRFPATVKRGTLDRKALGALVFKNPKALKTLEAILHPLVVKTRIDWFGQQMRARRRIVVLDIPLLFETKGERRANEIWVVSAPAFVQRQRAMARPGMTAERLAGVLARQMPDAIKRRRADVVLPTGIGRHETLRRVKKALKILRDHLGN